MKFVDSWSWFQNLRARKARSFDLNSGPERRFTTSKLESGSWVVLSRSQRDKDAALKAVEPRRFRVFEVGDTVLLSFVGERKC